MREGAGVEVADGVSEEVNKCPAPFPASSLYSPIWHRVMLDSLGVDDANANCRQHQARSGVWLGINILMENALRFIA